MLSASDMRSGYTGWIRAQNQDGIDAEYSQTWVEIARTARMRPQKEYHSHSLSCMLCAIVIAGGVGLRRTNWSHYVAEESKSKEIGWSKGLEESEWQIVRLYFDQKLHRVWV